VRDVVKEAIAKRCDEAEAQLEEARRLLDSAVFWGEFTNLAIPIKIREFLARTEPPKPGTGVVRDRDSVMVGPGRTCIVCGQAAKP